MVNKSLKFNKEAGTVRTRTFRTPLKLIKNSLFSSNKWPIKA
jgi:hypothetical protein